jgi:hypothetical protein
MKRKENAPGGCVGESLVPERIIEGDRPSMRCGIRSTVSSEDIGSSGSRVR